MNVNRYGYEYYLNRRSAFIERKTLVFFIVK